MATTTLLVEIVVIGVMTLIALCFDLSNFSPTCAEQLHKFVLELHLGSATGTAVIFGLAYPTGWVVNSLSYIFTAAILRCTEEMLPLEKLLSWRLIWTTLRVPVETFWTLWRFVKLFGEEALKRLTRVDKSDHAARFIGFLGNYNAEHAITMQNASEYSTRFILEHFSMVRIDRASLFVAVILLPASVIPINNPWWKITLPINLAGAYIMYHITRKAYTYYKLLRDRVGMVIAEKISWERRTAVVAGQPATCTADSKGISESLQRMLCFAPNPPRPTTDTP